MSRRKHKKFQAKHVELCGKLLILGPKLPCFRRRLPRFAANMSVRARTYIDFAALGSLGQSAWSEPQHELRRSSVFATAFASRGREAEAASLLVRDSDAASRSRRRSREKIMTCTVLALQ